MGAPRLFPSMSQHATSTAGDHGAVDVPAIKRNAVEHALSERGDAAWVLADHEVLQLAHAGFRRGDEAVEGALADAMQA